MNGKTAVFDSNIIIYLSRRELSPAFIEDFDQISISIITYMEILGYRFNDQEEEKFIRELLSLFKIIYISKQLADTVVQIRKDIRIKLPDAIIAATAISEKAYLITRNTMDFKNTEALLVNPFSAPKF